MQQSVPDFLALSPAARSTARLNMGGARGIAIWENSGGRIRYDGPVGHTFSLYLQGGCGTRRLDAGLAGYPGAVCIMPEGHRSDWEITAPFRFVHLYMPDAVLRATYARIHDKDARQLVLHDTSFVTLPELAQPLAQMARAAESADPLMADAALADLVAALPGGAPVLRSGLAPFLLRRVDDWIEAQLNTPIRLADLAELTDLSEFHFHRMFRASRGQAPHQWITARRVDRAKALLKTSCRLSDVATACGFSCQSHLTRVFSRETGLTPGQYRKRLHNTA